MDNIINISKYMFLSYIIIFVLTNISLITNKNNPKKYIPSIQIFITTLFYINSFYILTANRPNNTIITCVGIVFILTALNILALKVYKDNNIIINSVFFIICISVTMLYRLNPEIFYRQIVWIILGAICYMYISFILKFLPNLYKFKYLYLSVSIILFLYTIFFATQINGATNWIKIGNITFQPSEIIKILIVFYIASCFYKNSLATKSIIMPSAMMILFLAFLVIQKDLGSALIFFITYLFILYVSYSKKYVLFLGGLFVILGSIVSYFLFSHIKIRFNIWINPFNDTLGAGYQIVQSLFAITTYGFFGSGLTKGMPYNIPIVEKDFIFSAICEEFGVLFGICLVVLFMTILWYMIRKTLHMRDRFLTLISFGLITILCTQIFLIIGGSIKLIPLTGVTLPFVSYGGSSIIISFVILSILGFIYKNNSATINNSLLHKNIKKICVFYLVLFLSIIVYLVSFVSLYRDNIVSNPYNPRINKIQ